jgi:signal transduction histidine kinase
MRLLTKTTLYFITLSLVVFFAGGIGLYRIMQNLIEKEVNADLYNRIHFIFNELSQVDTIQNAHFITTEPIEIKKIAPREMNQPFVLRDTVLYNKVRNAYMPYRSLQTIVKSGDNYYQIKIYKSLITSNYLIEKVALIITLMLLLYISLTYFLNRYILGKVWSDFFKSLKTMQHFSLENPKHKPFEASEIIEFNELNHVLQEMTDKLIRDYEGVKEFTGNVFHEVQTPLSVIKNKTELLFQELNTEKQFELAGSVFSATNRLSDIIKSLGLLARIEKNQFSRKEAIDFADLINKNLELYSSMMESKNIRLEKKFSGRPKKVMDPALADILINNLIKNAVRHNLEEGFIRIHLTENKLHIANAGNNPNQPTDQLFEQFNRSSSEGFMGIGLAIVQKIVQHYKMEIRYNYNEGIHQIEIVF